MMKVHNTNAQRGFTLVEISIVLVIIGLLLGGILKGQELINNAKVRAIADRQNSMKAAWFAYIDRYQGLPGDNINAEVYIKGAENGDGNGTVELDKEAWNATHQLTAAGYLRCPQCSEAATGTGTGQLPLASNSLTNNYGGVMSIFHDKTHYATQGGVAPAGNDNANGGTQSSRLMVHTGPRIPSNIISEVDRKIDDGNANTGDFVYNGVDHSGTNTGPVIADCTSEDETTDGTHTGTAVLTWRNPNQTGPEIIQNCGGSVFI